MPEIEKILVKGFKSISDTEYLKLGPINVLIGANGVGKSNFIGVFSFLRELREGRLNDYVRRSGGADRLLHFGVKKTPKMDIHVLFKEEVNQYRIVLAATDQDALIPDTELVYFWDKTYPRPYTEGLANIQGEAGISASNLTRTAAYVGQHFDRWRVYHFHDTSSGSPLKKSSKISDNRFLRSDGSNLPSFLYMIKEKHPICYEHILAAVKMVFPSLKSFNLQPDLLNEEFLRLEWSHVNSDEHFDVSAFSDGTLRFIALAALFLQPEELIPSLVIVDEPELGLHPYAISILAALVKQASTRSQIILSTQSPLLLDNFSPEDVIVASVENGSSVFSRLESSALSSWLEEYSLGQLWEKNQFGGRPTGV